MEPTDATRERLQRDVLGPFLREQINQILATQGDSGIMRITKAPGLANLSGHEYLVPTDTMKLVTQTCQSVTSGSIGISGPRGVGKTTLLKFFCEPRRVTNNSPREKVASSNLRIMVSAPVEYDTRDFILHLFSKVCETVLETDRGKRIPIADVGTRRIPRPFTAVLGLCAIFICGAGLLGFALLKPELPKLTHTDLYVWVSSIIIVLAVSLLTRTVHRDVSMRRTSRMPQPITEEAGAWLTRIKYLQTLTTGHSGSMSIPTGPQLTISSTRQLSELQITLPDLIESYKDFATRCILWRRSYSRSADLLYASRLSRNQQIKLMERRAEFLHTISGSLGGIRGLRRLAQVSRMLEEFAGTRARLERDIVARLPARESTEDDPKMLIGIDEIDKIDADSAQRFLNDIKAIFGIPNCVYLVSVSDEALAVFEKRVLLGRTAFDSSFDEVIRARELDFESCRQLLRRRIAGIPDSLVAFCEVMSGGLPRDLIRFAREVVDACAHGLTKTSDIAMQIIVDQVETLKRAFMVEMSSADRSGLEGQLLEGLLRDDWPGTSAHSMIESLSNVASARLPMSLGAALYFSATIAEIFGADRSQIPTSPRNHPRGADSIDRLAQARNMISINSDLAWESISGVRAAYNLTIIDRPQTVS